MKMLGKNHFIVKKKLSSISVAFFPHQDTYEHFYKSSNDGNDPICEPNFIDKNIPETNDFNLDHELPNAVMKCEAVSL